MQNHYGEKRSVMAIIRTSLSWAAPSGATEHTHSGAASSAEHAPGTDIAVGAPEHTLTRFIDWIVRVVKTIDDHKRDPTVQEQCRRSGDAKQNDEKRLRAARDEARANFAYGADLNRRLELYHQKGKSKGKGKRDHLLWPIAWHEMSWNQTWYVCEFRNGNLWKAKKDAESHYCPRSGNTKLFGID